MAAAKQDVKEEEKTHSGQTQVDVERKKHLGESRMTVDEAGRAGMAE
jgi:hypothetical protein